MPRGVRGGLRGAGHAAGLPPRCGALRGARPRRQPGPLPQAEALRALGPGLLSPKNRTARAKPPASGWSPALGAPLPWPQVHQDRPSPRVARCPRREMAASCVGRGLCWVSGKMSFLKERSGVGAGCPGRWGSPRPGGSDTVWMWRLGTGCSRRGGVGVMVASDDLGGFCQPVILCPPGLSPISKARSSTGRYLCRLLNSSTSCSAGSHPVTRLTRPWEQVLARLGTAGTSMALLQDLAELSRAPTRWEVGHQRVPGHERRGGFAHRTRGSRLHPQPPPCAVLPPTRSSRIAQDSRPRINTSRRARPAPGFASRAAGPHGFCCKDWKVFGGCFRRTSVAW